jgi:hypothetical protein
MNNDMLKMIEETNVGDLVMFITSENLREKSGFGTESRIEKIIVSGFLTSYIPPKSKDSIYGKGIEGAVEEGGLVSVAPIFPVFGKEYRGTPFGNGQEARFGLNRITDYRIIQKKEDFYAKTI